MITRQLIAQIIYPEIFEDNEHLQKRMIDYQNKIEKYQNITEWISYPLQQNSTIITNDEVKNICVSVFGDSIKDYITIPDKQFKLVDIEHFKKWLSVNPTNKREYIPTWHDCNAFATILAGDIKRWDSQLCVGEIYVSTGEGGHALNILIDTSGNVWLVEPQTDEIFNVPNDWKPYSKLDF